MPLPGFVQALQEQIVPQHSQWFAYKMSEPEARATIAESLRASHGQPFDAEDIMVTTGAFAGLAVTLATIVDPGDEVIFISPPWFFYEALIAANGGIPRRVLVDMPSFDLDLAAITGALNERTRAIIINSPHNPTGKIYPPATLRALAALLEDASARFGRPIYLISDEAYNRIIFDGRSYTSPTSFYPNSFLIYTYGKTLLTPGQRIGYIALPPKMAEREYVRMNLMLAQIAAGYAFPNALLQYALPAINGLTIDIERMQRRRDRLAAALREIGYTTSMPEGTFYMLVKSPWADDEAFSELLASHKVFCLPGAIFEMPGYLRLSLTASDAMVERALPGFARAHAEVLSLHKP
jgi:aspartate aminotransferase